MNREIKFRAWNEVSEKMLNWNEFLDINMKNTFIAPESTGLILMQYTGLHDKNGKEIYEGDILKVYYKGMSEVGYVEYDNDYCEYKIIISANKDYFSLWKNIDLEKIGNKYDNPKLLEGE